MVAGKTVDERNEGAGEAIRIAFVVDWLQHSYQQEVMRGAAQAATQAGAQLIVLPGGVLGADHDHGARRNKLFELVRQAHYEGLVVMTGTLGNVDGPEALTQVVGDLPSERICHVAIQMPNQASVLIDNKNGIRRMVEHLIRTHGARKMAFIRGPEANPEAEARFQAFVDTLKAFEIELDERLILPGDFRRRAGVLAVSTLLDERAVPLDELDAIVAADDLMALAAMEELRRRGVRVPTDVAVVGFDDVEEARFASPPLSSVRQPLARQGRAAVKRVLAAARGEEFSCDQVLDTSCQFRRSCGCTAEDPGGLTIRPPAESRMSLRESVTRRRELLEEEMLGAVDGALSELSEGWSGDLIEALVETADGREEAFREAFDALLDIMVERGLDATLGNVVISALRRQLSVCAGDDAVQIRQVEGLLHDVRILTAHAVGRSQAQRRLRLEHEAHVFSEVSARLARVRDSDWTTVVARQLPRLGVENLMLLSLRGDVLHPELTVAGGALVSGAYDVPFNEFSPSKVLFGRENDDLLVQPLDDGEQCIGLAVFVLDEVQDHQIELLRDLLCAAMPRRE